MIELLLNQVQADGMKRIRIMSNVPVTDEMMLKYVPGAARMWAKVSSENTMALSLFYGEVIYPLREVVDVRGVCAAGHMRRLAVWKLMPEEEYRVSEIVEFLYFWFFEQTHRTPEFAFLKKLPSGVESGQRLVIGSGGGLVKEDSEVEGVTLMEAEWAMSGCVMVGG